MLLHANAANGKWWMDNMKRDNLILEVKKWECCLLERNYNNWSNEIMAKDALLQLWQHFTLQFITSYNARHDVQCYYVLVLELDMCNR